jgi:hypothetical protein
MKIGRNEPCWCGSGQKFKKCHLDRATQNRPTISEAVGRLHISPDRASCSCPEQLRSECSGPPINSHSIAKSLGLQAFSVRGHVLSLRHDFKTLKRTKGKAEIGLTGVNKASVFPGFCSHHDSSLFRALETEPFSYTEQQCAQLSYGAIARERYSKMIGMDVNNFLKGSDGGRSLSEQVAIQEFLASYGTGLSLADADLGRAIEHHHEALLATDYGRFESLVLEFSSFPVLCKTGHMPSEDWYGRVIQDLSDTTLQADWLTAVSFHSVNRAWVVFTWLRSSDAMKALVTSLLEKCSTNLTDALTKYFFSISENIIVDDVWWSSLDAAQKGTLNLRVSDGLPLGDGSNTIAPRRGEPVVAESALVTVRYV